MQGESDGSDEGEQPPAPSPSSALNASLQDWQQGDVLYADDLPFVHLATAEQPLTPEAEEAAQIDEEAPDDWLLYVPVITPGLVIVSQTCDVVRPSEERPYIELCPLRTLDPAIMAEVRRGDRPQYAALPGLDDADVAADLDRVMTIEKSILLRVSPTQRARGCPTEDAAMAFGQALARKRSRFAFPDDFVASLKRIQKRVREKHGRASPEGQLYSRCREIRARALPNWTAPAQVELWFLFDAEARIPVNASDTLEALAERVVPTGVFTDLVIRAAALDAITAKQYLESYPLDLDHLSGA